jgi:hypothetical protein
VRGDPLQNEFPDQIPHRALANARFLLAGNKHGFARSRVTVIVMLNRDELDGEIVCLDSHGKPQFRNLLFRCAEPFFYAFDILWDEHARSDEEEEMHRFRNGEDTRYLPLTYRSNLSCCPDMASKL